jgi:glucose/arabinose dehydrogenase
MRRITLSCVTLALTAITAQFALAGCSASSASTPTALQPASPTPAPTVEPLPDVGLELIADGLTAPLALVSPDDGSGRLFVVEQVGVIKTLSADGDLLPEPFLDLRDRLVRLRRDYDERGLLGLAFHPEFKTNGRFFVYYTAPLRNGAPPDWDHTNHVSEFNVSADPNRADADSERILLQVDQPYYSHDGGQLAFGPDGFLYIATGDGGPGGDPNHHAQSLESLLGKILRLDVNSGSPYAIPPDNPFVGRPGLDEVFAYGFRQPYRFSFDAGGEHGLIVADAGHDVWEEVNVVTRGSNYGWNIREGTACFQPRDPSELFSVCAEVGPQDEPLLNPVLQYGREAGQAIIGGYVYRGKALPALSGRYIFGDWRARRGTLFAALPSQTPGETWDLEPLAVSNPVLQWAYVLSLGRDVDGELYVLTSTSTGPTGASGQVFKIVPDGS